MRIQISLTDKFFSRRYHIPSLKKHIIEVYDPQPQDRPICFWTIAIYGFEHHLFDKNGQRKNFTTRTSNIPNWVSVFVSHSPHFIVLFSFSHTIFLHWVFFLLSMDLTDKQQQQLSLAKCARQRCNEWFVFCSGYFSLFSVVWHVVLCFRLLVTSSSYCCFVHVYLVFIYLLMVMQRVSSSRTLSMFPCLAHCSFRWFTFKFWSFVFYYFFFFMLSMTTFSMFMYFTCCFYMFHLWILTHSYKLSFDSSFH